MKCQKDLRIRKYVKSQEKQASVLTKKENFIIVGTRGVCRSTLTERNAQTQEKRRLKGIFRWRTAEGSLGAGKLKAEMQNRCRCCCVGFHVPRVKGQEIDGNNRCFFRIMKVVPRE